MAGREMADTGIRSGTVQPWLVWSGAALLLAAAGSAIWFWPDDEKGQVKSGATPPPAVAVDGVKRFTVRDEGKIVWQLAAKRITVSADHSSVMAEEARDGVYFRDGKPYLRWRAQQLKLTLATRDAQADGNVEARGQRGFSLRCAQAKWSNIRKELSSEVPVRVTLDGAIFDAPQMVYATQSDLLRCQRGASAKANGLAVKAGSVEFALHDGTLRCAGGVFVEATGATLRGGSATVDTRKRFVTLSGGVEIRAISASAAPGPLLPQMP